MSALDQLPLGPGPVYHDPRDGKSEPWRFNVVTSPRPGVVLMDVHRFRERADAETAREEWTS